MMKPEFTDKPEFMRLADAQKRNAPPLLLELLILLLVYIVCTLAELLLAMIPEFVWLVSSGQLAKTSELIVQTGDWDSAALALQQAMPTWIYPVTLGLGAVLGVGALLYCRLFEKRKPATLGLCRGHVLRHLLLGLGLGLALSAGVYGLAALFGGVQITGVSLTIQSLPMLLLFVLAYLLQGFGESLFLHGYFFVSLTKRQRLSVSLIFSSFVYAMMSRSFLGNQLIVFLNALLLALFAGLLMLKTGDIWCLFGLYGLWGFCGSGLLLDSEAQILGLSGVFAGTVTGHNELLTGGSAGLSASLCATFVLLACVGVAFALLPRGTGAPSNDPGEPPTE